MHLAYTACFVFRGGKFILWKDGLARVHVLNKKSSFSEHMQFLSSCFIWRQSLLYFLLTHVWPVLNFLVWSNKFMLMFGKSAWAFSRLLTLKPNQKLFYTMIKEDRIYRAHAKSLSSLAAESSAVAGQKKMGPDGHCNSAHGSMLTGSSSMSSFLALALSLSESAWQHFNHLGPVYTWY